MGLNIRFISQEEFSKLPGVNPKNLNQRREIDLDPNYVGKFEAKDAVVKSINQGNVDHPSYTTRVKNCSNGFLRVRLGTKVHSHMMFHLWGCGIDPTEKVRIELPEEIDKFFNNLDYLIGLAVAQRKKIHIDYVVAGSIESSEGERVEDGPNPAFEKGKEDSKKVRETVQQILAQKTLEFKAKAEQSKAEVTISSSNFTDQKFIWRPYLPKYDAEILMTNIHYDGQNTLSINASRDSMAGQEETYLSDDISPEKLVEHYSQIELSDNHHSPQALEALKSKRVA